MDDNKPEKAVKCVVWDLDGTLWDGVLAEEPVTLRPAAADVVKALDGRGILQSLASRNDHAPAMAQLEASTVLPLSTTSLSSARKSVLRTRTCVSSTAPGRLPTCSICPA